MCPQRRSDEVPESDDPEERSERRWVLGRSFASLFVHGAGAIATLALGLALGRLTGAADTGLYYIAFTAAMVTAVVARVGLDTLVVRSLSASRAQGDAAVGRASYHVARRVVFVGGVVFGGLVVLLGPWIADTVMNKPAATVPLQLAGAAVPFIATNQLHIGALKGTRRPVLASFFQAVATPLVTTILLFVFLGGGLTAPAAWALLGAAVVAAVLSTVVTRWVIRGPSDTGSRPGPVRLARDGLPFLWISSIALIPQWADTLMLGALAPAADVGGYAVAARLAAALSLLPTALQGIIVPRLAEHHARGDSAALQRVARMAAGGLGLVAVLPALLLILLGNVLLGLFGPDFEPAYLTLSILVVGTWTNVATTSSGPLLSMTGHERQLQRILLWTAFANVALNLALIPPFGMEGAAVATTLTTIGRHIVTFRTAERLLGIKVLARLPPVRLPWRER